MQFRRAAGQYWYRRPPGSGKTAVLVERVVGLLLDEDHPVDADRLLVMTFSNAAALEMKQRIMARVSDMLAVHPDDEQLLRQQLLLGRAQIGTVHSFCISLIRENFQLLGISPNLRVADEKELEILRRDCAKRHGRTVPQRTRSGVCRAGRAVEQRTRRQQALLDFIFTLRLCAGASVLPQLA